jgi:eukaryotic-like serine/threonine-protein kinase
MSSPLVLDEDLLRRLPLPLAQLYRRAHNAKTPQERHHTAYYLWEAALKLLGSVAIVAYAELGDPDPELVERLRNLARPSLGHWWEFVRRLLPVLADRGDRGFAGARELLLGKSRADLPRAAGLDAVLLQALESREPGGARATVRLTELFDRLVRYRNREFGHGATGQKPAAFYDRVGRALLSGVPEILERLDPLAGRRLVHVADVRRQASGRWLVERYELRGEAVRRLESLDLPDGASARRLLPDRLYLESVAVAPSSSGPGEEDQGAGVVCLHPLLVYEADSGEALFLNARRGRQRADYLSYSTGREVGRADLESEQRELLARVLQLPVDAPSVADWAARSQAEEQADGGPDETGQPPRRLGEFELFSELGRGGMGVVYRAWQPSLGRQVAVKALFRTGDPRAEARFAREIRALGHVEHPHLVKIFVSGSEGEQWFYAMELVEGATLAAVCEKLQGRSSHPDTVDAQAWQETVSAVCAEARQAEKPLSDAPTIASPMPSAPEPDAQRSPLRMGRSYVRQAAELVRQVAEATHALHERGILHRDIKPGNIIVTADGSQAVLMDLGLAQIADEVEGRLTKTRQFVGTLRYASPEQVLAVGGLDRRSDVYNLGATLWELLTLRPLFGANDQTPTPELMRRIQVEDPERPRKHHPAVARDLEAIVLKCLEKDPGRRYATARELVRDLERFQAGEPVQARPVSGLQRGWRWCRRKPVVAGLLASLALVVVGSLVGLTALYLHAEGQRKIAVHREEGARAITRFYEDHVLAAARPEGWEGGTGKNVTLKEALNLAAPKIDEAFAGQPELEAAVRNTLGMTYQYLGDLKAANLHLEKAYEIRRQQLGPEHPDTLTSLHNLSFQRWREGRYDQAVSLSRQAFEGRRRVLGPEHPDTIWTQIHLGGNLYQESQYDEAEKLLAEGVEACKRILGPDHQRTLYGQNDLALVLWWKGKEDEAIALDRQTLEGRRRALGPDHPDTLRSMDNLGSSLLGRGQLVEAEALVRQALETRRRILGAEHIETLWSEWGFANLLGEQGKPDEAEKVFRQTLAVARRTLGPDNGDTLRIQKALAQWLQKQGQLEEAERLCRQTVEAWRGVLGPENSYTLWTQCHLVGVLGDRGKLEEAEKLGRQTLEGQRRALGHESPDTLITQNILADVLGDKGNLKEADKLFAGVLAVQRKTLASDNLDLASTLALYGDQLTNNGRPAEAEPLLRECLAIREKKLPPGYWPVASARGLLGGSLARQGKFAEAEPFLVGACETLARPNGAGVKEVARTFDRIIEMYQKSGKPEQAEAWRKKRPAFGKK